MDLLIFSAGWIEELRFRLDSPEDGQFRVGISAGPFHLGNQGFGLE
ncbi:MAG TPA: hypothetical protein VFZ08_08265 [Terriglobia bacterium]|nr:hypothetical protein [Terriglobia bacterium]